VVCTDARAMWAQDGYWIPTNFQVGREAMQSWSKFSNRLVTGLIPKASTRPSTRATGASCR
jgi:hypothetical protein